MVYGKTTEQEEFESELEVNMLTLKNNLEMIANKRDREFATKLVYWYEKYESLSTKQALYAMGFWKEINALGAEQASLSRGTNVRKEK